VLQYTTGEDWGASLSAPLLFTNMCLKLFGCI